MRRLLAAVILLAAPAARADHTVGCLVRSGKAGVRCLAAYTGAIERCRRTVDVACETALRAPGGTLDRLVAQADAASRVPCTAADADVLGYVGGLADVGLRTRQACGDFAEDLLAIGYSARPGASTGRLLRCQRAVAARLRRLRGRVIEAFGPGCFVPALAGRGCARGRRDHRVALARADARRGILDDCGPRFAALGLAPEPGVAAQLDDVLDRVVDRARHFAESVYPPHTLGPTAEPGPFPVGVQTLALVDPSRTDVTGSGPRPVTIEVYYPSTPAAVAGVPHDIAEVLGVAVAPTPAFRDVARAPGPFPLVLFSHGNGGIRFQSIFLCAHLASHGYVVASPDHRGDTFVDLLMGLSDPQGAVNRPLDMRFVTDRMLAFDAAPGNFFADLIDAARIAATWHSFGGFTDFLIAGGASPLGTFTDPRVRAIFPMAPAAVFADAFFATITVPTLIVGGTLDTTVPFAANQQRPFEALPAGALLDGLAELTDVGHFTFSDLCEVPRNLSAVIGGFDEACQPRHLPWRYAHRIVNFFALNFFDAVLKGDPAALARLAPAKLTHADEITSYQTRQAVADRGGP